jgi:sulfopropanediol 3-dehydrogenase
MARYLKRGMDASAIKAADAQVRATVESILAQVEAGGDAVVRSLSEKFDHWSPASFRLSEPEIERAIAKLRKRDVDDIRFAQAQVRNFAQKQKETLRAAAIPWSPQPTCRS